MFYYFAELLDGAGASGSIRYALVRAALAFLTAFGLSILFGPRFIRMLRERKFKERAEKKDAEWLAEAHKKKNGTPTMGGLMMIAVLIAVTLAWCRFDVFYTWLAIIVLVQLGLVGLHDDWLKLNKERYGLADLGSRAGLSGREKLALQVVIGLTVGTALYFYGDPVYGRRLFIPSMDPLQFAPFLGLMLIPLAILVVAGTSNAVNLADGLDGLAAGNSVIVLLTFALLAFASGHPAYAEFLAIPHVPGAEELAIVCSGMIGAGLGFLWFNSFPAQVFMGDTGSLAIGGLIATVALVTRLEILLLIIGGVFVWEALSVIIQVASYKTRKRRVFLCAPYHHHLERKGWPESKIVTRFWIAGVILAVGGVLLLKLA